MAMSFPQYPVPTTPYNKEAIYQYLVKRMGEPQKMRVGFPKSGERSP